MTGSRLAAWIGGAALGFAVGLSISDCYDKATKVCHEEVYRIFNGKDEQCLEKDVTGQDRAYQCRSLTFACGLDAAQGQ